MSIRGGFAIDQRGRGRRSDEATTSFIRERRHRADREGVSGLQMVMSQGPGDKEYEEFSLPLQQMEQYAPEHYSDRLTRGTQGKINKVRYVILSETPGKYF